MFFQKIKNKNWRSLAFVVTLMVATLANNQHSFAQLQPDPFLVSKKIYQTLTGKFLQKNTPIADQLTNLIAAGDYLSAARLAAQDPSFTGGVVRSWAANLLTLNQDPLLGLNDSLALMIGSVRDNLNAKMLLAGNYTYGLSPKLSFGRPKTNTNDGYDFLDQDFREVKSSLYKYEPQWDVDVAQDSAGVLTTRYWASVNYSAGTNRRVIPNMVEIFLCKPKESWKRPNLPTSRIRQDIDRFPTGNAQVFQTECRTCHSIMDGMAGAFAKINYDNNSIIWSRDVMPKYTLHPEVYNDGFVTKDSSWVNYIVDQNGEWGWKTVRSGMGIRELGQTLADTEAFPNCMVKTVAKAICKKDIVDRSNETMRLVKQWKESGLGLNDLFIQIAVSPTCL